MGPEIYPAPLERIPRNAGQAWPILDHAARGTMECWSVGGKARPFGEWSAGVLEEKHGPSEIPLRGEAHP